MCGFLKYTHVYKHECGWCIHILTMHEVLKYHIFKFRKIFIGYLCIMSYLCPVSRLIPSGNNTYRHLCNILDKCRYCLTSLHNISFIITVACTLLQVCSLQIKIMQWSFDYVLQRMQTLNWDSACNGYYMRSHTAVSYKKKNSI